MSIHELSSNRDNFISNQRAELENISLNNTLLYWRAHIRPKLKKNYQKEASLLLQYNLIPTTFANGENFTIGGFRHIRHQSVINYIKEKNDWSTATKQQLVDCYISFVKWLDDLSFGWFKKDLSPHQISLRAMKQTLTFSEWRTFIDMLCEKNIRDGLIARCLLQGQKRISEVLSLTVGQIEFENNLIKYAANGKINEISYEKNFMKELKEYITTTDSTRRSSPFVFITRTGEPVTRLRLNYSFAHVSKQAGIKKVTPDSLRGMWKMFIQQNYNVVAIIQSKQAKMKGNIIDQGNQKSSLYNSTIPNGE